MINFLNNPQFSRQMELPPHYDPKQAEPKWQKYWEKEKIYAFDPRDNKREIYSIDTPPPTVSGKVHIGHAFSYSQQDFVVRFQRMRGKNIFYPFGTDNNGVPTERLIEKTMKVRARDMPREEFIKLCLEELEKNLVPKYISNMKQLGISCDYDLFYTTINEHCRRISQRSFIELYRAGREYRKDAPSMWCPECETGISQVECIDKEIPSYFNELVFKVGNKDLIIATTRPELLPACVAVFYHPDDQRYQKLKSRKAKVPLFGFEVPIMEDERADPEKGTGIVMCCTFGDQTDMEWQKAHNLPIKEAITKDGKMSALAGKYAGMKIQEARKEIIEELKKKKWLIKQEAIKHAVNVHERCGMEIEYIKSKQWFIRYLDLKEEMLRWGKELNWFPGHMFNRYENWVKGLQWDWLISRQRYFGVPFPVWYCAKCEAVILAEEKDLPVDPLKDKPPKAQCPKCGHGSFIPEKDVLDTWATSSLTPRLAVELMPKEVQGRLFPMSLRPQAHDIITFWLFNTVIKSNLHYQTKPFCDVMISGWLLDPKGKKMSKSKGNIIEPQEIIGKYGSDALRFMAAGSKLGEDLPFPEKDVITGQKMITKLWNAFRFCQIHLEDYQESGAAETGVRETFDRWLLSKLHQVIRDGTENFERYEYSRTKLEVEKFFWHLFCDHYLEIVKDRLYNPTLRGVEARQSAQQGLYTAFLAILQLTAPIMPHITEEIYQLYFARKEGKKSIHLSDWPKYNPSLIDEEAELAGDIGVDIINTVRKYKSERQWSMKEELSMLVLVSEEKEFKKTVNSILGDLQAVLKVKEVRFEGETETETEKFSIKVGIVR